METVCSAVHAFLHFAPFIPRNHPCIISSQCNSGDWDGVGIYYGGSTSCSVCGCHGGGFSGPSTAGKPKGDTNSLGLRIKVAPGAVMARSLFDCHVNTGTIREDSTSGTLLGSPLQIRISGFCPLYTLHSIQELANSKERRILIASRHRCRVYAQKLSRICRRRSPRGSTVRRKRRLSKGPLLRRWKV